MKFICNGCAKWHNDPCILDVGEEQYVSGEHMRCPFKNAERDLHYCKWEKYEDGEVANLQPEVAKLPKLTAEVFDRADCPVWAKYAAVDKYRNAMWYEEEPKVVGSVFWNSQRGQIKEIPGKFDASDWENSLIERHPQFPDWVEVGGYVYDDRNGYGKIVSGSVKSCYIEFDGGAGDFVPEALAELKLARIRPYNVGEVPDLPFEVSERNSNFRTIVVSCNGDKVWLAGATTSISTEELMREFTTKGEPCGVLEHLEDGEWKR